MALRSTVTVDTTGIILAGSGYFKDDATIAQDAARVADLVRYTLLAKNATSKKLVPLTDVAPALTPAYLTCGANGGNIAAYELVTDGEFAITIDGEAIDVTGLNFDTATTFQQVEDTINNALAGRALCVYDALADVFSFYSLKQGLPQSSITVLSAVSGGSGTDISGASYLNGLTGTGTVTAATGGDGEDRPAAILISDDIATADLVAGDVTNQKVWFKGDPLWLDEAKVILENSLDLDDTIIALGMTIRDYMEQNMNIFTRDTYVNDQIAPV